MGTQTMGTSLVCSYEIVETNLWIKRRKYGETEELGLDR